MLYNCKCLTGVLCKILSGLKQGPRLVFEVTCHLQSVDQDPSPVTGASIPCHPHWPLQNTRHPPCGLCYPLSARSMARFTWEPAGWLGMVCPGACAFLPDLAPRMWERAWQHHHSCISCQSALSLGPFFKGHRRELRLWKQIQGFNFPCPSRPKVPADLLVLERLLRAAPIPCSEWAPRKITHTSKKSQPTGKHSQAITSQLPCLFATASACSKPPGVSRFFLQYKNWAVSTVNLLLPLPCPPKKKGGGW